MKRFHVHVAVDDLQDSVRFYSTLFGVGPSVHQSDYAKWMLDDPKVNFAISSRGRVAGVNHLGFQVESDSELAAMQAQLQAADSGLVEQTAIACCYARSDKYWITDPSGIAWETFHTLGSIPVYEEQVLEQESCCIPLANAANDERHGCCVPSQSNHVAESCCK
jgi:catechol 2,3-dioxygenase-like lactoylglutathione lyase family enzyme